MIESSSINKFPKIVTERLILDAIKETDAKDYNRLCMDKELNKYFLDDNPIPTKENFYENFFVDIAKNDYKSGECLSFAIRKDNKFIGEALIYNFVRKDSELLYGNIISAEIGIRIFEEYSGNGFAKETVGALIDYCLSDLKLKKIVLKSFKENIAMKGVQMLFDRDGEDEKFYYFVKYNKEIK